MLLASNGSSVTANAAIPRAQVPASIQKHAVQDGTNGNQSQASSPCSGLSSPLSVTSHAGAHSGGTSSNTDDLMAMKAVLPPRSQADPPQAITSIGAAAGPLMPAGDAYFPLETTKDLMFCSAMIVWNLLHLNFSFNKNSHHNIGNWVCSGTSSSQSIIGKVSGEAQGEVICWTNYRWLMVF